MSLFAIGDLHLSLTANKPMDVFGPRWENYVEKIKTGFSALTEDDVCVLCGDVSWGIDLDEALEDFRFIEALPGRKIILKGNHDYWWTSAAKLNAFLEKNDFHTIAFLHNNAYPYGDNAAVCGTKGWFYEESRGTAHDKKLIDRETLRLEASLKAAGERDKYVFLHYPPKYGGYLCPEILSLLRQYQAKVCCSGHLHGDSLRLAFNGSWEGTRHICVSGDGIFFKPCKIL
ncbi:MAG: metallophosphoesterase [Oscillospiraceae bacterium]|nr:metallophosphoesterase [Oscillospiraceae bacterium]